MEGERRFRWGGFLLGTRPGRMALLGAALFALLWVLPRGCSRKTVPVEREGRPAPAAGSEAPLPASPRGFEDTLTLGEKYQALIARWGGDLAAAKDDLAAARGEIEALKKALAEERSRQESERKGLLSTLERVRSEIEKDLSSGEPGALRRVPSGDAKPEASEGALRTIRLAQGPSRRAPSERSVRIPTAASAVATLLNGVFAPTAGEPSPVRLRLEAALLGPNRSRVGLRNAFLIGKAQGDPNSSRVLVQVDRLSYVGRDGKAVETRALGYVVGEDGLEGIPGRYEWRAWDLVPPASLSSALAAGSEALAGREVARGMTPLGGTLEVLSGDALKHAGFRGLGGGTSKLTEILVERMREIRPAVSVAAGRPVTVVFLEGVTLEGLAPSEVEDESGGDPFGGLDLVR